MYAFPVVSVGLSLPSVQTIAPSGDSRDSGMKMACWPAGICYWDNSRFKFEYHPGAQHANADGMSRQCGQCQRPDCPVSATETDSPVPDVEPEAGFVDQPFASSEMGESMDTDLLPELSGETWVASTLLEEFTADLLPAGANLDLIAASRQDATLATVWQWIQSDSVPV